MNELNQGWFDRDITMKAEKETKVKLVKLYHAVNELMCILSSDGEVNAHQDESCNVMSALADIDGGCYDHDFDGEAVKINGRIVATGPKLFSFASFGKWVSGAQDIWKVHCANKDNTVCIDQKGRLCRWGRHFMIARDDNSFPIDVYLLREDMQEKEKK